MRSGNYALPTKQKGQKITIAAMVDFWPVGSLFSFGPLREVFSAMKTAISSSHLAAILLLLATGAVAHGEIFGSGNITFEIEFVTIGDPGNIGDTAGDPNPVGSVSYTYRMGKYEISEQMVEKANALAGLGLPLQNRGPNKPATLAWYGAAKFVNWLNTSKAHHPAYKFDTEGNFDVWQPADVGFDSDNLYRNTQAQYVLPDVDEWYKAAYYDPVTEEYFIYPTGSNERPISVESGTLQNTAVFAPTNTKPADIMEAGGLSPYGTMAQGGNIYEWQETHPNLVNSHIAPFVRIFRGGTWASGHRAMQSSQRRIAGVDYGDRTIGFRVVHIPEPTSLCLFGLGVLGAFGIERRNGTSRADKNTNWATNRRFGKS